MKLQLEALSTPMTPGGGGVDDDVVIIMYALCLCVDRTPE